MSEATQVATPSEKSERAAAGAPGVDSRDLFRPCPICGAPMLGRRQSACSDRCRAAKSRRARVRLPVSESRRIKASLATILETAWEIKATLEGHGG